VSSLAQVNYTRKHSSAVAAQYSKLNVESIVRAALCCNVYSNNAAARAAAWHMQPTQNCKKHTAASPRAAARCNNAQTLPALWHVGGYHVTHSLELGYVKPLITAINPKEETLPALWQELAGRCPSTTAVQYMC
jgi:hypothetical protein